MASINDFSLSDQQLLRGIMAQMNQQMTEAAEPLIQESLKKIERTMRERLAAMLISHIEQNVTFERSGADLRITIRQAVKS